MCDVSSFGGWRAYIASLQKSDSTTDRAEQVRFAHDKLRLEPMRDSARPYQPTRQVRRVRHGATGDDLGQRHRCSYGRAD